MHKLSHQKISSFVWLIALIPFVLIDQLSKQLILNNFTLGAAHPIMPGLNLTLAFNHGVAFSLFSEYQGLMKALIIAFIVSIVIGLFVWLFRLKREETAQAMPLVLILSGAVGNLIDRFRFGYVIDFFDCYLGQWHWYIFNVADIYITLGAFWMLKLLFFPKPLMHSFK